MDSSPKCRRALILGIASALLCALIVACGGGDDDSAAGNATGDADRLNVVATIVTIEALAREVGGDLVDIRGIVPPGADAHEFEPVASDLQAIEDADVILRHGVGIDDWLDDTLSSNEDATIVVVTEGVELHEPALVEGAEEGEEHEGEEEGLDPHVWHDPDNDKIMVTNIADALAEADPATRASTVRTPRRTSGRSTTQSPKSRPSSTRYRQPAGSW
jgi:ABC-type Zn uptake system ZnuABC Zn-binding protein ZnuA